MTPQLTVGSLVRTNSGTRHHGTIGIVVDIRSRWTSPREDERLVTVLYSNTNEELSWSEFNLEVLA